MDLLEPIILSLSLGILAALVTVKAFKLYIIYLRTSIYITYQIKNGRKDTLLYGRNIFTQVGNTSVLCFTPDGSKTWGWALLLRFPYHCFSLEATFPYALLFWPTQVGGVNLKKSEHSELDRNLLPIRLEERIDTASPWTCFRMDTLEHYPNYNKL